MSTKMQAFALFACAIVSAASLTAVSANDEESEVGLLLGHEKLFAPFCLSARRFVVDDIKQRANDQSSGLFKEFFGAASEIADEVLTVEQRAVRELTNQLAIPEAPVSDEPLPEDKVQALVEEGKRKIAGQPSGLLGRMVVAGQTAGSVLYNAANSAIFVRLAKARTRLSSQSLFGGIVSTCSQVNEYEQKLVADLAAAKEQLVSENQEPEIKKFIESVSVPSLKCFTPKTVSRLNAFCELFKNGSAAFMKMLGLNGSKYDFSEHL